MLEPDFFGLKVPHQSRRAQLPHKRFAIGRKRHEMHLGALDARICGLRIERGDLTALRQVPHPELGVRCESEQHSAIRGQSVLAHFPDFKGQASLGDFDARRGIPWRTRMVPAREPFSGV